jgi:sec-independent protein translocase protein TatB
MFGVDTIEFIIVALVALLVIGPKDLPVAMRALGRFIGKIRGMARHFNAGVEAMIRESELDEMEKKWREENDRIMREYPALESEIAAQEDQPPLPLDRPDSPPREERELP